jgi:glc operon protein GlcG
MNLTTAQKLVDAVLKQATDNQQSVAVAIVDDHGELISFAKMDSCSFQAALLAKNKAYTSARDRQPTANLGAWAQQTNKDMGYWTDPKITGLGGGVPIDINGEIVGAIGVSGLSEQQDEDLARSAIQTVIL